LGRLERLVGPPLARPLLDRLLTDGAVHRLGEFVCLPAFAPRLSAAEEKLLQNLTAELLAGGFQPPTVDALRSAANVDRKRLDRVLTLAVATGVLVPIEPKMFLHAHAEGRLRGMVQSLIERQGAVTVAQVREALGSSRKYVVPFLEYLDRIGFTRRTDDVRTLAGGAQAPERPT
jgi:selenocysteine-specific elongation factor